jgi:hypothetical protein
MNRLTSTPTTGVPRGLTLALALVAAGAAAQEQPFHVVMAPGKVAEVCMPLKTGDTLRCHFEASSTLDFNLHHHVGPQVLMPVENKAVKSGRGEQLIDQGNEWCLMWKAALGSAPPVTVQGAWSVQRVAAPK